MLQQAVNSSSKISIYFSFLDDVTESLQRIQSRVARGGHLVPEDAVRRRYPRCFQNFWSLYRHICDYWHIFNNLTQTPTLLMQRDEFKKIQA